MTPAQVAAQFPGDADFHRQQAATKRTQAKDLLAQAEGHVVEARRQVRVRDDRVKARELAAFKQIKPVTRPAAAVMVEHVHRLDIQWTRLDQQQCPHCQATTLHSFSRIISSDTTVAACNRCDHVSATPPLAELMFKPRVPTPPELHVVIDVNQT
ncbi:MAG: hypothetical protein AAB817_02775 [Patescibacteria group bacterium]